MSMAHIIPEHRFFTSYITYSAHVYLILIAMNLSKKAGKFTFATFADK